MAERKRSFSGRGRPGPCKDWPANGAIQDRPGIVPVLPGRSDPAISVAMSDSKNSRPVDPAPRPTAMPVEPKPAPRPKEIGGPEGPEPTRYGDWEKNGRCSDF